MGTLIDILIFLFILGILIIVHEFGHFIIARVSGIKVNVFSIGFGPRIIKKSFKTFDFRICAIPFGGYVKLAGAEQDEYTGKHFEFLSKPVGIKSLVVVAGPVINYIFAWVLFCLVFSAGVSVPSAEVGEIMKGYPAAESGLQAGDVIVAVGDKQVNSWSDLTQIIHNTNKEKLNIEVLRGEENLNFVIPVTRNEVTDIFGKKRTFSFIGIKPSGETVRVEYGFFEAVKEGTLALGRLTFLTLKALGFVIIGAMPAKESLTGPVGIFFITKQASDIGISAIINLMAVLSMSLAIINLFPLPVLDGGHIILFGLEKIRGKPLSAKAEELITRVGVSVIIILSLLVLYLDIEKVRQGVFGG